jgi:hypothetical protein
LTQIIDLHIRNEQLPLDQLIQLLTLAVNVQSLTLSYFPSDSQNQLKTLPTPFIHNKISKLVIYDNADYDYERQLHGPNSLFRFFPRLECLEIPINARDIPVVCRFLLAKLEKYSPQRLQSIFFFNMEDQTMDTLRQAIDAKQILKDYTAKPMRAGWHLWW